MKLVLYGGGDEQENLELDQKLLSLFPEVDDLQIAYIPFATEYSEEDFLDFFNQFRKLGIKKIIKLELDRPMNSVLKNIVLKSDIIHLGGGNTFYFLKHLKKSHFMNDLKNWVAKGGVLTGLSAGAILMTKNIETAAIPEFDRDDNDENLKNLNAMSLVNFEFFPHYKNSTRYDREIINRSKQISHPIYACRDGAGIIIDENEMRFVGKTYCFYQGKKLSVSY